MDYSLEHHKKYLNRPANELTTPSLVLSRPVIEDNIKRLHDTVEELGIQFRPHVKTLKAIEVTELMLGHGKYPRAVASTLSEIRGMLPLVQRGLLRECLYGLPIRPGALSYLLELSKALDILLMIDNKDHVQMLEEFSHQNSDAKPWNCFIKVNVGSNRAGAPANSERLKELTSIAVSSSATSIVGFYCHAGHSYACRTEDQVENVLQDEFGGALEAAKLLPVDQDVIISIGSTPTAHVVDKLKSSIPSNIKLELHAGNFCVNDLQQLSTSLIDNSRQAVRVCAEVCSVYPERNEALINAGVIALSRETSIVPGFGRVVDKPDWHVMRLSQEHGILGVSDSTPESNKPVPSAVEEFKIGQKVFLHIQHACITAAAFYVYYVVDQNDIVREVWRPWKGW